MRIVIFDFQFDPRRPGQTGLSDVAWNLATHLAALGDDVHLVGPYHDQVEPPIGVEMHRYWVPRVLYSSIIGQIIVVMIGWLVLRKIRGIDLIHSPEYLSTAIISLLLRKKLVILTTPGNIFERIANGNPYGWLTTQVYKWAARVSARNCALIIAISDNMASWWRRTGAPSTRLSVLPYGVNTRLFRPIPNARITLGLSADSPLLFYVGRLSKEKGIELLFHALRDLRRLHPQLELNIVGTGPQRERLESLAVELNIQKHVRFIGWVSQKDLPLYYSAADIVLMPSVSEPLGRVAMEAMACGAAVIASDVSGVADLICNGQTGLLVRSDCHDAIASAVDSLLSCKSQRRQIGHHAHVFVNSELDWKVITNKMRDKIYALVNPDLEGR